MLMHGSVCRLGDRVQPYRSYWSILGLTVFVLGWPTFIHDDYRMRGSIVGLVTAALFARSAYAVACIWLQRFPERFTRILVTVSAVIAAVRGTHAMAAPKPTQAATDFSLLQHVYLASFAVSIVALSLGFLLIINRRLQMRPEHAASHDSLARTLRRDAFFNALVTEVNRALRYRTTLSLLMIDLDKFKQINDRYGHLEGDQALAALPVRHAGR